MRRPTSDPQPKRRVALPQANLRAHHRPYGCTWTIEPELFAHDSALHESKVRSPQAYRLGPLTLAGFPTSMGPLRRSKCRVRPRSTKVVGSFFPIRRLSLIHISEPT